MSLPGSHPHETWSRHKLNLICTSFIENLHTSLNDVFVGIIHLDGYKALLKTQDLVSTAK